MDEHKFEWLVEFILGCLTPEEKARVTAKANERMEKITAMIMRNPDARATTAECAIEHYLYHMAEQ